MSAENAGILDALAAPFAPHELKYTKVKGKEIPYVDAKTAMDRLDQVVGGDNWRNSFVQVERGVVCTIEIHFEGKGWIGKSNAGGYAGMTETTKAGEIVDDDENDVKSGFSDAFKRAAMTWGIGRHPVGGAAPAQNAPARAAEPRRDRPHQPDHREPHGTSQGQGQGQGQPHGGGNDVPRSGGALYSWANHNDALAWFDQYAKKHGFPGMLKTWTPVQVATAWAALQAAYATSEV